MQLRLLKYKISTNSLKYVYEATGTSYSYTMLSAFKIVFDWTLKYMFLISLYDDKT